MIVERRLDRLPSGKTVTGLKHRNSAYQNRRADRLSDKSV
ncbi:hypothetical protein C4K18_0200 [Pseudomonas chlororaphis subsp. aurantiaca]|nr:hypothetical protein C4K18_0200 [Pseudomonas chlororaphis subsp. aurantiaca]